MKGVKKMNCRLFLSSFMMLMMALAITAVTGSKVKASTTYAYETIDGIEWKATIVSTYDIAISPVDKTQMTGEITIPDSVDGNTITKIYSSAFNSCKNITNVSLPATITNVNIDAFQNCSNLESFEVAEGNRYYASVDGALYLYQQSSLAIVPNGMIGAFEVTGDTVRIVDHAFDYCNKLTSVSIPASVAYMSTDSFRYCGKLASILIDEDNTRYASEAGVFYDKNKTTVWCVPKGMKGKYVIPDTVTTIGMYALQNCAKIIAVSIPEGVTTIKNYAFAGCTVLTDITIPSSVSSLGTYLFADCTSLTDVTFPENITSTSNYMFSGCTSLTNIDFLDGMTTIKEDTFNNCTSLQDITIPDSITTIEAGAFAACKKITSIYIPAQVETCLGFGGCSNLISYEVAPENTTYSSLDGVLFNKDQTILYSFPDAKGGDYVVPDGVVEIYGGNFCYSNCIKSVVFPDGLTTIDGMLFIGCSRLESITFPNTIEVAEDAHLMGYSKGADAVYYKGTEEQWNNSPLKSAFTKCQSTPIYFLTPSVTEEPESDLSVDYTVSSEWDTGYNGSVTVTNNGTEVYDNWQVAFSLADEITNVWSASTISAEDGAYVIGNAEWNGTLEPGQSVTFGFTANKAKANEAAVVPENITAVSK